MRELGIAALIAGSVVVAGIGAQHRPLLQPSDFYKLQSVGDVQLSPTDVDVAYSVISNNGPGRPSTSTWLRELASGTTVQLEGGAGARWSPDGQSIAYFGRSPEGAGLIVANRRGAEARFIAPVGGTNHPLPSSGKALAWSPDGLRIAYVSAVDGPESKDAGGDPMLIRDGGINGAAYVQNVDGSSGYTDLINSYVDELAANRSFSADADLKTDASVLSFASNSIGWLEELRSNATTANENKQALYERTHGIVFTWLVRITGSRKSAETLTCDVFHDVWRRASTSSTQYCSISS